MFQVKMLITASYSILPGNRNLPCISLGASINITKTVSKLESLFQSFIILVEGLPHPFPLRKADEA